MSDTTYITVEDSGSHYTLVHNNCRLIANESYIPFEEPTPPTPTTLTWSPNPFYMNSVVPWGGTDYVLSTATAPASGQYNVTLNAYNLRNTYYSATQVRFRICLNGTQSGSFALSYQSQDPYGEQSVPITIYASAGDVITIEYKSSDNVSGNFELTGSVSIS